MSPGPPQHPDTQRGRCRPTPQPPARPLPTPTENADLLARCLAGDREAWDTFVSRFSRLVLSTVGRTFLQFDRPDLGHVADDVTQDVFLSLLEEDYRVLRTLRDPARLPGWLTVVARNKTIDALRRHGFKVTALAVAEQEAGPPHHPSESLEAAAARESLAREALGALDAGDRLLIELFYFERRRYRDIALLLGIPENTVASRLYRIKRRLLRRLTPEPQVQEQEP